MMDVIVDELDLKFLGFREHLNRSYYWVRAYPNVLLVVPGNFGSFFGLCMSALFNSTTIDSTIICDLFPETAPPEWKNMHLIQVSLKELRRPIFLKTNSDGTRTAYQEPLKPSLGTPLSRAIKFHMEFDGARAFKKINLGEIYGKDKNRMV